MVPESEGIDAPVQWGAGQDVAAESPGRNYVVSLRTECEPSVALAMLLATSVDRTGQRTRSFTSLPDGKGARRTMPILEFLCPDCNRIFDFFAQGDYKSKEPVCPRCEGKNLQRQISRFSVIKGGKNPHDAQGRTLEEESDLFAKPGAEAELKRLMSQAESMDENDPKQLGQFMRKMSEVTGEPLDAQMEEAVRRLEAGEDPDKIEEDLGDVFDDVESVDSVLSRAGKTRTSRPTRDDGLYTL